MLELIANGPWGFIRRTLSLKDDWPGNVELNTHDGQAVLAGPINLDLYNYTREGDDFLQQMCAQVMNAGIKLHDWSEQDCRNFLSAVWRSAHRFVVENVDAVDRSPEFEELAKVLKVDL